LRQARFFILERVLLPLAVVPLRWWIRSWRLQEPDPAVLAALFREPRLVFITFHGMLLHLLAFAQLPLRSGRSLVVLLSPSLDGRLLAATLRRFGIESVRGTTGRRSVGGAVDFIQRLRDGKVGMIAVDGPVGPCCVPKPGPTRLAAAAGAHIALAVTTASRGLRFGTWDRAHLPLPFARVELHLHHLSPLPVDADEAAIHGVGDALLAAARTVRSPVLPT
jgi:lysophospholipid acyltransferase (LPLAT)-like uncharacterized protein